VDRWAAPSWVPFGNVFSVGDLLIAIGVVVTLAAAMGARMPFSAVSAGAGDAGPDAA
jgi:hypothetical protein